MGSPQGTPAYTQGRCKKQSMMSALKTRWRLWRQARQERVALQQASDATLKDIGLTRQQVRQKARRPFE